MRVSDKSLESWIWDAACSIHGAKDAALQNLFRTLLHEMMTAKIRLFANNFVKDTNQ